MKKGMRPPKPFPQGVSGNPGGAPKGKRISTWMLELGQLTELPDPDTLPINGRIASARIMSAMEPGGERSTELILDRTEGKLTDSKPPTPTLEPWEVSPESMRYPDSLRGTGVSPEEAEAAYLTTIYQKALETTGHDKALYRQELEKAPFFIATMRKLDEIERDLDSEPAKPDAAA